MVDLEDEDLNEFIASCLDSEGFGGAIIIDDPIKPDDALSPTIRNKVNQKFDTTIRNRVNSRKTPIIIIGQRVHENDLCGFLLKKEPGEWFVLSLPCIKKDGTALWEFKHTIEELKKLREINAYVFDTQYQQDPKPLHGLMYEKPFREYEILPIDNTSVRKAYIDTADEGDDYLCAIIYDETKHANFIVDVLYTQKAMEYTEVKTAEILTKYEVRKANIESNNGGRGFARNVEKYCRELKNYKTEISWFHQSENKAVRIFSKSADVQNLTYMPKGWDSLWPQFYTHITTYMKIGKNEHDDAEDSLTGTIEMRSQEESEWVY